MIYKLLTRNLTPTHFRNGSRSACVRFMTSTSKDAHILLQENDNSAVLIINRPKVLNAFSMESIRSIDEHLRKFERTKSLVIIKGGSDGKSFSVGGDISTLLKGGIEVSRNFFKEVYTLLYFISNYKIPQIALMDGVTMGGGVGFAVHGRYCVATERTILAMPETGVGLFPDVGSSYFLNRLNGKIGLYLGLTGRRLIGKDVAEIGLATHFCQSSSLPDLEDSLTKCSNSNEVVNILNRFSSNGEEFESKSNLFVDKINTCFAGKSVEDICKNLEHDGSDWARGVLQTLSEKCPLSLKITYEQLKRGEQLPLSECLKMEYRLAWRCLASSNFYEGVRALLIDKDKQPKWNPSTLEATTEVQVAEFFNKIPDKEELKLQEV